MVQPMSPEVDSPESNGLELQRPGDHGYPDRDPGDRAAIRAMTIDEKMCV